MTRVLRPSGIMSRIGLPVATIVSVWFLYKLPREVIDFAVLWVLVSVVPAIAFGHCALSSER
jgi:hypothetical protein